ncbi:uncharacterized protein LOC119361149 [Triticum dicoccoides]|uniref:uncharacterized protein LOC119361149 n=1 Tax=Triticum dicoccoides TaxID=85692 RepID=UPI00188DDABF|nr:uncharacterized protein LOC119361149 [Triticum dicoccoides]XP_044326049.1 uncharacterized protein LOC123046699 [Triticum aestivum]
MLLGGHFSFSGDLLAEDRMLEQAGFAADSPAAAPVTSDATVQETEAAENEAWLEHMTAVLLGSGRRPFLAALTGCLGSPDAGLVAACLTTAGWLSRSLASSPLRDTHTDMQLAAFSALVPRLKRCLAGGAAHLQPRHRVLAAVTLHNFSKIPDCTVLLMLPGRPRRADPDGRSTVRRAPRVTTLTSGPHGSRRGRPLVLSARKIQRRKVCAGGRR